MRFNSLFICNITLITALFSIGCVEEPVGDLDETGDLATSTHAVLEGTPQAIGLLALLNDPATTLDILDHDVRLDSRAAKNLIHRRDGYDQTPGTSDDNLFESVAEVDRVRWVGNSAIGRLLHAAENWGWVPEGDERLGRWDRVAFTVTEAALTLEFVNQASHDLLDHDLGLDRRAADSIVAAQPITSVATLAGLYYVGHSALDTLKEVANHVPVVDSVQFSDQFNHDEADEIPDGDNYGLTTRVHVASVPDVRVGVVMVVDFLHDAQDELHLELTSPTGDSWEFVANDKGTYPIGALLNPNGYWRLTVSDRTDGNVGELYGWALEVSTDTTESVMQDRFKLDLAWWLGHWYRSYGADAVQAGGHSLEEAREAIDAGTVTELADYQDDPEGNDPATTLVLTHSDVVFPGGDTVWFVSYDRETGTIVDVYDFQ